MKTGRKEKSGKVIFLEANKIQHAPLTPYVWGIDSFSIGIHQQKNTFFTTTKITITTMMSIFRGILHKKKEREIVYIAEIR